MTPLPIIAAASVGVGQAKKNGNASAKNSVRKIIWYMVSVSANSVVVMPRTAAVTLPNRTALASANIAPKAETVGAWRGHQQHAEEARGQRAGAGKSDLFLQPQRGEQGCEERRRKINGDGAGQRHQAERDDDQALRGGLRRAPSEMVAQPPCAQHEEAGARQDQRGACDTAMRWRGRTEPRRRNTPRPAISRARWRART